MRWLLGLAALAFLTASPLAAGSLAVPASAPAGDCLAAAADNPPCGYVAPTVNLDMEGKKPCRKADHTDCIPVPSKGNSVSFQGKFQYYWKLSEDGTYPPLDPNAPVKDIEVSFSGVSSNHQWLTFKVEPDAFVITQVDLLDPNRLRLEEGNVVYYWYERDVTVTITHSGDPTQAELDRVANKNGVANILLKVRTTSIEPYFKEGFGTEDFRFDASSLLATVEVPGSTPEPIRDDDGHAIPAGSAPAKATPVNGLLVVAAGLGVALVLRRRAA